jgi:hypothetical protein
MWRLEKMVAAIKTDVESIAEAVFVCCDSDYNQTAICPRRRTPKATALNA